MPGGRAAKDKSLTTPADLEELVRKRDAFITSMTMLRNAAEEASRAGLAYFDHVAGTTPFPPTIATNGLAYIRGMSMPPMSIRAATEEPEVKRKRKRGKRDPDMPKRPMTAYLLFCHEGRGTVKKDLGDKATHKDVLAELTRRWKEMPDEDKKGWQEIYQNNRSKYEHNIAAYKAQKGDSAAPATANSTSAKVNHTADTDEESDEDNDTPEPEKATELEPEPEPESEDEQSEHEEEEEESEESEEEEAPPAKQKTPRGKKTAAAAIKKTPNSAAASSPAASQEKKRERKTRPKRGEKEKEPVEEEPEAETPKKKSKKRRKSAAGDQ